jgi:hypothetical protein
MMATRAWILLCRSDGLGTFMINTGAMPALYLPRRVAHHHRRSTPIANDLPEHSGRRTPGRTRPAVRCPSARRSAFAAD